MNKISSIGRAVPAILAVVAFLLAWPAAAQLAVAQASHDQAVQVTAAQVLRNGTLAKVLASYYPLEQVQKGVYIGQEYCLACHSAMRTFKTTMHSNILRRPMVGYTMQPGLGVVADVNGNGKDDFIDGLDFNTISSVFDAYKPNAPVLSVKSGVYTMSISGVDYPLVASLAGGHAAQAQRFIVRLAVADTPNHLSAGIYFAPIAWDAVNKAYTANNANGWWDATTKLPKFNAASTVAQITAAGGPSNYGQNCLICHSTGMQNIAKNAQGEWIYTPYAATVYAQADPAYVDVNGDGTLDLVNITCESCHGPGSNHVLGGPDPAKIVNPRKLTGAQQVEVCGRCHATAKSKPNGTFSFPVKDDTMTEWYPGIGQPLADFFTDATSYWPDGKLQKGGRPWGDYHTSLHATNPFHVVSCTSCHDLHTATSNPRQVRQAIYDTASKLTIFTSVEENTFCLSCHATHGPFANVTKEMVAGYATHEEEIGKVVAEHTHHPYAPERQMGLSRCVTCHMAATGGGHSWRAVSPELTIKYKAQGGMPNSCANGCHNTLVNLWGMGTRPTSTTYDGAFDQKLAEKLQQYYGPGGSWWNTNGTPMAPAH